VRLWALVGLLVAVLLAVAARPMIVAWRCYERHASGTRADAELVEKLEGGALVLQIKTGPGAGKACTARTSSRHYEALEIGEHLLVVHLAEIPGECTLESTLENSLIVLWAMTGLIGAVILVIAGLGVAIHRSFVTPGQPQLRMEVDPSAVGCPVCERKMGEGYLPLLAGLHWRELGEPVGLPHALSGLPGTFGWRGRPRLHAFRCTACQVVTFQYGRPPATNS
jgi:hypothetical protein